MCIVPHMVSPYSKSPGHNWVQGGQHGIQVFVDSHGHRDRQRYTLRHLAGYNQVQQLSQAFFAVVHATAEISDNLVLSSFGSAVSE